MTSDSKPTPADATPTSGESPASSEPRDEAATARDAIASTVAKMRATLSDASDLRAWTREYPWTSVGAAATIGFLVAAALTARPSRRRSGDLLQKILADEQIASRVREISESDAPPGPTLMSSLGAVLIPKLANVLEAAVIAALTPRPNNASPADNGRPDDRNSSDSGDAPASGDAPQ
jgi:hypothetical protein